MPGAFALIAVTLLIYGNVGKLSAPALVLASATLIAACVRAAGLLREGIAGRERGVAALRQAHGELEERVAERTAELEALSQQNQSMLNSASERIWGVDWDGNTVLASEAAAQLTGYSVEELLGPRSMHELIHHTPDGTPYPAGECPAQQTLSSGTVHAVSDEL